MKLAMRFLFVVVAATVALPADGGPGSATPGGTQDAVANVRVPGSGRWSGMSEEQREEVRKKIEAVRIYRLTEELKLDQQTAAKLAALLGSLEQQQRDVYRAQAGTMRELREALGAERSDERKLNDLLGRLERNRREKSDLRERERKGLKDILTVEQQARYLVFQKEFRQEIRRMIEQARGGDREERPGRGPRNGGGPDGPERPRR